MMTPSIAAELPDQAAPASAAPDKAGAAAEARSPHVRPGRDSAGGWLYAAAAGLFALAGAAAAVSFSAQYRLVYEARRLAVAAALEAAIPDAAALVFACLGVALALHGRRAIRARLLNLASAGTSVAMNVIAAAPGWRDLAVWAMPPAAYAMASDTLIGVVRASAIARHPDSGALAEEVTVVTVAVGVTLWLLRLAMAPRSTLGGFRGWVLDECPVAPGRRAPRTAPPAGADPSPGRPRADLALPPAGDGPSAGRPPAAPAGTGTNAARPRAVVSPARGSGPRGGTKTARFLALAADLHGPLAAIPLGSVARISAQLAPQADLNGGAARAALRRAVLAAQDGGRR
jgi:hypothetical protein